MTTRDTGLNRPVLNSAAPIAVRIGVQNLIKCLPLGNADSVIMTDNWREVCDADYEIARFVATNPGQSTAVAVLPVDPFESVRNEVDLEEWRRVPV